jgi:hypothetical protein
MSIWAVIGTIFLKRTRYIWIYICNLCSMHKMEISTGRACIGIRAFSTILTTILAGVQFLVVEGRWCTGFYTLGILGHVFFG